MSTSSYYALIMAGGKGTRFWPKSTTEYPKQFQDILAIGDTLLQSTVRRMHTVLPPEHIYVLTNANYASLVRDQTDVLPEHILKEPAMRNTAPCILYGAMRVLKRDPEATVLISPSDHHIVDVNTYCQRLRMAMEFASQRDAIVTLGITPTYPSSGYGYIHYSRNNSEGELYPVQSFTEKPNLSTAQTFIQTGEYLWNAGIFVAKAQTFVDAYKRLQPQMYALFADHIYESLDTDQEDEVLQTHFEKSENVSVDYAIMEKSDNIYTLPCDCGWNDVGTWQAIQPLVEKDQNDNTIHDHVLYKNATDNIVQLSSGKVAIIQGLDGYIVVETDDKLLICKKENEQEIRSYLAELKQKGWQ